MIEKTSVIKPTPAALYIPRSIPELRLRLDMLEAEIADAKTYERILTIEREANAIKALYGHFSDMKRRAEEVFICCEMRIGVELAKQAPAKGTRGQLAGKEAGDHKGKGKAKPVVSGGARQAPPETPTIAEQVGSKKRGIRLKQLAAAAAGSPTVLKETIAKIHEAGRDASVTAVLEALAHADKKNRRDTRERELGARQMALPDRRYGVIYADPEWRFEFYSETGKDRSSADMHYPTSPLDAIKGRDVPSVSADDCVLFLWATVPMLTQALEVMDAWGFKYKSAFVWIKNKASTGYWCRNQHEHLLIGTRGAVVAPAPTQTRPSVVEAPVGRHSEKPAVFYEVIEELFPSLLKLEMNMRGEDVRPGWDVWGFEAPASSEVAAE